MSRDDAFAQLDAATKDFGINFIDTAESYPAPAAESLAGRSEELVGSWLRAKGNQVKREDLVLSACVSGFSEEITWLREGGKGTRVTAAQLEEAVDAQVRRRAF